MQPLYFDAVLQSAEGAFMEAGKACLSQTPGCVDFTNEFVPLLKLAEPVQVSAVLEEKEIFRLKGEVYLSGGKIIRITVAEGEELDLAKRLFFRNTAIDAPLALHASSLFFSYNNAHKIDASIYYIDHTTVKFSTIDPVEVGQQYMLRLESPLVLKKMLLKVVHKQVFGRLAAIYICKIAPLASSAQESLEAYLETIPSLKDTLPAEEGIE